MPKRTTIILDDEVYKMLVEESVKRYGNVKSISRLVNELLGRALKRELEAELRELLSSKRITRVTAKEFEEFRRSLSKRFET